ncbi:MAG: tyrosine--tRNA ligase [Evtepia sp.]|nr:tyrosine--tRNA ligase [Evtepia sp.]
MRNGFAGFFRAEPAKSIFVSEWNIEVVPRSLFALCQKDRGCFFLIEWKGNERMMELYDELVARGLIAQVTDEVEIKELINNGKAVFYIGFDPTADSLHVGHFMALCLMKRLQMAGNRPIALIGGGTGMIGDPSGRTDMRMVMTPEIIQHNCDCFKKQMEKFIEFGEGKAMMVNNADWLLNLNYIELLRDVGACFSVNTMLRAECYKNRMEKGLTFFEFNYMIMQAYDFYHLYQHYGCNMQFGGDDQWSNMLAGTELIRRKLGKDAYAMTIKLLLTSDGKKMGKSMGGAVWLDPNKTSPYEFYQYWRNVEDADVLKCIRMLTFLPLEEIDAMESWEGSQLNQAKEILAFELTKMIHGEEDATKAQETAKGLFSQAGNTSNMPSTELSLEDLTDDAISVIDLMIKSKLTPSKGEARRLIQQGGVEVSGEKLTDIGAACTKEQLSGDGVVIKKGKKVFHRVFLV